MDQETVGNLASKLGLSRPKANEKEWKIEGQPLYYNMELGEFVNESVAALLAQAFPVYFDVKTDGDNFLTAASGQISVMINWCDTRLGYLEDCLVYLEKHRAGEDKVAQF